MAATLPDIKRAVEAVHGAVDHYEGRAFVHERVEDKTVWKGHVEVFALKGHPKANRAYAWAWDDDGEIRYSVVLEAPPIHSPREAVQAAIASGRQR